MSALGIASVCFPGIGGSGVVAAELALGLAARGHRVHVIAERAPLRPLPNVSIHEVRAPSYPLFDHAPYTLALAGAIARVCGEQTIDVLHVHYAVPHAASAYLARQLLGSAAPRLITTLHGTDVTRVGSDPAYQPLTRMCVESSEAISVPSLFLRDAAYATLGIARSRAIEVIPNFVDTERFAPPPARSPERYRELFEAGESGPLLFHVSNFRSVKRVTDLLEVLARVRQRVPARLALVGDGPDRAAAVERARHLGLQRSVAFLGQRAEFADILREADAFLLTSETESFGLAALEALSCGVPVFGYRVGGVPAVVTEDVGRLVEPFDLDGLAAAVVALLGDSKERERLSAQARARVLASFRSEPALDAYERLYRGTLGER